MKANLPVFLLTAASFVFAKQATANSIDTQRYNGDVWLQSNADEEKSEQFCRARFSNADISYAGKAAVNRSICYCVEQAKRRYPDALGEPDFSKCEPKP